jgi:uncharacterized membrane protein
MILRISRKFHLISLILGTICIPLTWIWLLLPSNLLSALIGKNEFTIYSYFIVSFSLSLLGIILGLKALKEKTSSKIIAIIGIILSLIGFLTTIFFFLLNVMIKPS